MSVNKRKRLSDCFLFKFIFLTKGEKGVSVYNRAGEVIEQQARKVKVIDTTGAGDCFIGCVIYKFLNNVDLTMEDMDEVLNFAVTGSSLVITKKGAMNAMPTLQEINKVLEVK